MRSSRLAFLALTVGSGLLGFSTVGVTAIAGNLPQTPGHAVQLQRHDHAPADAPGHPSGRGDV